MSVHFSKYDLNTYGSTSYFRSQIPHDYPLGQVLINCRAFRRLPPNIRKLSALAKKRACLDSPDNVGMLGINEYYDDEGYELNPSNGKRLTDKEIDDSWAEPKDKSFKVSDIPVPPGGFADPSNWTEPVSAPDPPDPDDGISEEQLRKDINSHGPLYVAREAGIPESWFPHIKSNEELIQAILGKPGFNPALAIDVSKEPRDALGKWTKGGKLTSEAEASWSDYGTAALVKDLSRGKNVNIGDIDVIGSKIEANDIHVAKSLELAFQHVAENSNTGYDEVWRGTILDEGTDVKSLFKKNSIHTFSALTAVAKDKKLAAKYTDLDEFAGGMPGERVLFQITRTGGVGGVTLGAGSEFKAGDESILPKGAKYKIKDIKNENGVHIITLHDDGELNKVTEKEVTPPSNPVSSTGSPPRLQRDRSGKVVAIWSKNKQAYIPYIGPPLSIEANDTAKLPTINVVHDWDTLKVVMVGRPDNDIIPRWYPTFDGKDHNEVDDPDAVGKTKADYDPETYGHTVKQTDALCKLLEKEGITVYRPPLVPLKVAHAEPVGLAAEWMREVFTVIGNRIIVNQPRAAHRNKDHEVLEPFFAALASEGKATICRPPPCDWQRRDKNLVADPRPFLEGGDIFRLGKDVLVTISYMATSPAGCAWLRDTLAPDGIEVWPAYLTQDWEHGDYIFMPIRPGLCVAYLKGFVDGLLPSPCLDWDCVTLTRAEANESFAANGIVLRENVVLLPKGNRRVVRALNRKGVEVIEVPFDGPQYWQGAVDCATSELWRDGPCSRLW